MKTIKKNYFKLFSCSLPLLEPSLLGTWWRARWDQRGWSVLCHLQNIRCDCDWWRNSSSLLLLQDKILLSGGKNGSVTVTNDGATILKAIGVDNPAAKVLVGKGLERNMFFSSSSWTDEQFTSTLLHHNTYNHVHSYIVATLYYIICVLD